jgi:glycosyltransferase involved in cell wall biosynthesis
MLVARCREVLSQRDTEIVLVDNGSTDSSPAVLKGLLTDEDPQIRATRVGINQGYGFGILAGLAECRSDVVGWTHADLQTNPTDFLKAIPFFQEASDPTKVFVKGSRFGRPLRDLFFAWCMAIFEWRILGTRMWDINAQPTVFHKKFLESWVNAPHDFSLDLFAFHQAVSQNLELKRFPVHFGPRLSGSGHNDTLLQKFKYSKRTIDYSIQLRARLRSIR